VKLLTATSRTQGQRASDFNWCTEGELVTTSTFVCDRDIREGPDGGCGCGRAFAGLNSHSSGTTAMIRDVPLTAGDLALAIRGYRESAGWLDLADDAETAESWLADEVADLIETAEAYPVGAVLEYRMGALEVREVCTA
jgi:hypothetical protein